MGKKRIGIYDICDSSWIGGKYYIDSITQFMKNKENVELVFLPKENLGYRLFRKVFGVKSKLIKGLNYKSSKKLDLDYIYPCNRNRFSAKCNVFWIPDFQENYYPEFFSVEEICTRLDEQVRIAYSNDVLVLSSEAAKMDFERLYPKYTCKIFVLPFVSSLYGQKIEENKKILDKYNIKNSFFIVSNQFWKHKNHQVVLEAIKKLNEEQKDILVVFTGREDDYRSPHYFNELKKYVEINHIEKNVLFLGFIPRKDQVDLMNLSIAVIQPSYFEGWNTTIEDAKYLKQKIIASNLNVHHEQLADKGIYFECDDSDTLKNILENLMDSKRETIDYGYEQFVANFKDSINKIFY